MNAQFGQDELITDQFGGLDFYQLEIDDELNTKKMNFQEVKKFIEENIQYKNWEFFVNEKNGVVYLQVKFDAPDNIHPERVEKQHCRKWQLSEWMTPTEIVETAWAAVQRAELHEAAEQFRYKGKDIYNRHINVERLVELRNTKGSLQHRPSPAMV